LDVYGNENFGKKIGGDIIENKKTYLSIKAYQIGSKKDKKDLDYWKHNSTSPSEKVKKITQIFNKLNIKKLTEKKINLFFDGAYKKLDELEFEEQKKDELKKYLKLLLDRKI